MLDVFIRGKETARIDMFLLMGVIFMRHMKTTSCKAKVGG